MVKIIEAGFNVSLQEPCGPAPFTLDFFQRTVTTARASETVTAILEVCSVWTIVDGFEDEPHYLLYDLVPGAWDSEFPHFPITFWDERPSNGTRLVLLSSHLIDKLSDFVYTKSVNGFLVCAWGHIPRFRLDALVSSCAVAAS